MTFRTLLLESSRNSLNSTNYNLLTCFCDIRLGILFDLRSRYVVDIFQYPEISGNGRGSGHACSDERTSGHRKWHIPPRNKGPFFKGFKFVFEAFLYEEKKYYRPSIFER